MKLLMPRGRRTALVAGLCLSLSAFAAPSLSPATAAPSSAGPTEPAARVAVKLRPAKGLGVRVKPAKPGRTWIGALRSGKAGTNNYAIDPTRRLPRQVSNATLTSRVDGSGANPRAGSSQRTARAAYIVSTYGASPRSKADAAAVELALDHLLQKKQWGFKGKKTLKRTKSRAGRNAIRRAKAMLNVARTNAGPYRINLSGLRGSVGKSGAVEATVLAASGSPLRGVDIQFRIDGKDVGTGTTNANGIATVVHNPDKTGQFDINVTASNLPGSSLRLATPIKPKRASRIVLAGQSTASLDAAGTITVAGTQSVTLIKPFDPRAGNDLTPAFRYETVVPGGSPTQQATSYLYGPFQTEEAANASCARNVSPTVSNTGEVKIGGEVSAPTLRIPQEGFYALGLALKGNEYNDPLKVCGAVSKVNRVANITATIAKVGNPTADANGVFWQKVRLSYAISNLPAGYNGILTVRETAALAGTPAPCPDYSSTVSGNPIAVNGPGTYTKDIDVNVTYSASFRGFLSGAEFMPQLETGCEQTYP